MGTMDQMIIDQRYTDQFDHEQGLYSNHRPTSMKDDDNSEPLGRRVFLESPSLGNKEEEDMYRYVPSRLSEHAPSVIGLVPPPPPVGTTLMDSLDLELDMLGSNNTRPRVPYRANTQVFQESKPAVPRTQLPNSLAQPSTTTYMPLSDPRQDPILGPLLAELDAMSNQQSSAPPASSAYRHNPMSYESNILRPTGQSQTNHALAHRTITDALLEAELHDSLQPGEQQPFTRPIRNSANYSQHPFRPTNMTGTDVFMPSSYPYEPASFLSQFGSEEQLFQRSSLNHLGQNYLSNPRAPQMQQRDPPISQPQRPLYAPPQPPSHYAYEQQPTPPSYQRMPPPPPPPQQQQQQQQQYEQQTARQRYSSDNQDMFFNDQTDPHQSESHSYAPPPPASHTMVHPQDDDSKRQTVWNDLQRNNAQKRESANRYKGTQPSGNTWQHPSSQQSSVHSKPSAQHQYRPSVGSKVNHIDDNIDMIRNKENSYHRSPTKRYENPNATRKELDGYSNQEQESQLPVTMNMHSNDNAQYAYSPKTVAVPINSQVNRVGDKISLNIDLRLVDAQNMKDQSADQPHWSGLDPLDQHIRKLERNLDQALPTTHSPQRSPVVSNTGVNASNARYGKMTGGTGRAGYNPPMYGGNQIDRNSEEDSYLAKMNYAKKSPQFKPYTGRDYEQFKKNYGFGTGHLGYEHDNTTYKEKTEASAKTREYAQQVEARNKKKLFNSAQRTWSDTRLPNKASPGRRVTDAYDM